MPNSTFLHRGNEAAQRLQTTPNNAKIVIFGIKNVNLAALVKTPTPTENVSARPWLAVSFYITFYTCFP